MTDILLVYLAGFLASLLVIKIAFRITKRVESFVVVFGVSLLSWVAILLFVFTGIWSEFEDFNWVDA